MRCFVIVALIALPIFAQSQAAPEQIAALEARLQANPEDQSRFMLLDIYRAQGNREARLPHVYWLIEHHPEWLMTANATLPPGTPLATQADYDKGKQLWLEVLKQRGTEAQVLINAAAFLQAQDVALALDQLRAAYKLAPGNANPLARFYASALADPARLDAAAMQSVQNDLAASTDARLLYMTGSMLRTRGLQQQGEALLDRAKAIDPEIERSLAPAVPQASFPETPGVKRIRVGSNIQAAKLKSFEPASYPDLAKQARIQGVVRFNVLIGTDGTVRGMQLISGHPLLVQPAQSALAKWTYQTTLLNGEPCEVVTAVDVNFTLN